MSRQIKKEARTRDEEMPPVPASKNYPSWAVLLTKLLL
jgi:hypothetical protein